MKDGTVYVGKLSDDGKNWRIQITRGARKIVSVAKADVVGIKAVAQIGEDDK